MTVRKIGVEEELLLVDPATGRLTAVAQQAIQAHDEAFAPVGEEPDEPGVEEELFLQQIETTSAPCRELGRLADELRRGRRSVTKAALDAGAAAAAMPTPILVDEGHAVVTNKPRYRRIRAEFGELAKSSLACAMHVHVDVADDEEGVTVLDGIGPWLPVILAVSANSPYWLGRDTGYASWRAQIWTRWPGHGTGQPFGNAEEYHQTTKRLVEWGASLDIGMVYFDARLSQTYPTVEIRVADVCTDLDDAILVAALSRGLVEMAARGRAPRSSRWRSDLLRAAAWRASRYGTAEQLVDPQTLALRPARDVVTALIEHTRPALEEAGDLELVRDLTERLLARGNGAIQQRRKFETARDLDAVVADLCQRTEDSGSAAGTWLSG